MAYSTAPTTNPNVKPTIQGMTPEQRAAFTAWVTGLHSPQAPPVPGGAQFVLPGSAEAEYQIQRQGIGETYNENVAQNAFQRANAVTNFSQQEGDLATQYARQRNLEPNQFVNRGILGSGIQHADLQQMTQDRISQIAQFNNARAQTLGGFDLARQQLERKRTLALANIAQRHAANLSDAAGRSVR